MSALAEPRPALPIRPPIVEFEGVSKTYDDGFTAIKNITFRVEDLPGKGEFITILGPSGCGKSTILRLIAGLAFGIDRFLYWIQRGLFPYRRD